MVSTPCWVRCLRSGVALIFTIPLFTIPPAFRQDCAQKLRRCGRSGTGAGRSARFSGRVTTGSSDLPIGLNHRLRNVVSSLRCMNDPQPEGHMATHIERRKFLATRITRQARHPTMFRSASRSKIAFFRIRRTDALAVC
jgi:hypothetical protein